MKKVATANWKKASMCNPFLPCNIAENDGLRTLAISHTITVFCPQQTNKQIKHY